MIRTIIVDDEPAVIKWLANQIHWEDYGYQLYGSFSGGHKALAYLQHHEVHLLITDICMPDMDGLRLIAQARILQPGLHIVVISAYSEFNYLKEAIKLGVEDYLLKPIDQNELAEVLYKIRESIDCDLHAIDQDTFQKTVLRRWLGNGSLASSFKEQARLAGIDLSWNSYSVLTMKMNACDSCPGSLQGRLNDAFNQFSTCRRYFIDLKTVLVCVVYGYAGDIRQQLQQVSDAVNTSIREGGDHLLTCVGPAATRYNEVNISYEAAYRYLSVMRMIQAPLLFCEDCMAEFEENTQRKLRIMRMRQLMRIGDYSQAEALMHEAWAMDPDPSKRNLNAINLTAYLLESFEECGGTVEQCIQQHLERYHDIHGDEMESWIGELFLILADRLLSGNQLVHPRVRECLAIMGKEYGDSNLSLKIIAQRFAISPAYLGQMFKAQTGKYFNDYLCDLRLNEVNKILVNSQDIIGNIARQVGFTSQSYMNKLFKARYKVTPNEYRALLITNRIKPEQ